MNLTYIIFSVRTVNKEDEIVLQRMSKCFISKTYVDVKSSTDFDNVRSNEGVKDVAI